MKEPNKQAQVNSIYGDNIKNTVKKVRLVATYCEWRGHGQVKCERKARVLGLFYILTWVVVTQIILTEILLYTKTCVLSYIMDF